MQILPDLAQYDDGLGSLRCLPYEVRAMILGHLLDARSDENYYCLENVLQNCTKENHGRHNIKMYSAEGLRWRPKGEYNLNTGILHASKALHTEASNYLYNTNGMIRIKMPIRDALDGYDPFRFDPFFFFFQSDSANVLAGQNFLFDVDVDFTDPDIHAQHRCLAFSRYQAHTVIQYLSRSLAGNEMGCRVRMTVPRRTESNRALTRSLTPWLWLQCYDEFDIVSKSEDIQTIRRTAEELKTTGQLSLHEWKMTTSISLDFIERSMTKEHGSTWHVPFYVTKYCSYIHKCTSQALKAPEDFSMFDINMRAGLWWLVSQTQSPIEGFEVAELDPEEVLKISMWASDSLAQLVNKNILSALPTYGHFHHFLTWLHICLRLCAECMGALGIWNQACTSYTQALDLPFHPRAAADTVECLRRALEVAKSNYTEETGSAWQQVGEQADWSVVLQHLREDAQPMDAPLVFHLWLATVED